MKAIRLQIGSPELSSINITNQLIATEAINRGHDVDFLPTGIANTGLLLITMEGKNIQVLIKSAVTRATAGYGIIIARNKYLTAEVLLYNGISTPDTIIAKSTDKLQDFLTKYQRLVVKPLDASHGKGISLNISNLESLEAAIVKAQVHSKTVLIQQMVEGIDHRLLVVNGKMIAASKRVPAYVVGNGVATLDQLIDDENKNPLRGSRHTMPMTFIDKNEAANHLNKLGINLSDIPRNGDEISLIGTANLSTGGEAHDITDLVHPAITKLAVTAAEVCGLAVCGVDVITNDISADPAEHPAFVIELNEAPGIRMHHFPSKGQPRNVAAEILDMAITANNDKV